jgi:hypothetical protein
MRWLKQRLCPDCNLASIMQRDLKALDAKVSRARKAYRVTAAIARNPRTQPHELRP